MEILGDEVEYQRDYYEDMLSKARRMPERAYSLKEEKLQEKYLPLYAKAMNEWATRWVDDKIPALEGKTPRESLRTPEGKKKVEELLKDFENMEERKKRDGEPYLDIDILRKMLNI